MSQLKAVSGFADINQKNSLLYYWEMEYKWGLEYYTDACTRKEKWNNMAHGRDLGNMRNKGMDFRKVDVSSF